MFIDCLLPERFQVGALATPPPPALPLPPSTPHPSLPLIPRKKGSLGQGAGELLLHAARRVIQGLSHRVEWDGDDSRVRNVLHGVNTSDCSLTLPQWGRPRALVAAISVVISPLIIR